MADIRIMLTPDLEAWSQSRVREGRYASVPDYLYALVIDDQNRASADRLAGNVTDTPPNQS